MSQLTPVTLQIFRSPRSRKSRLLLDLIKKTEDGAMLFRMAEDATRDPKWLRGVDTGSTADQSQSLIKVLVRRGRWSDLLASIRSRDANDVPRMPEQRLVAPQLHIHRLGL